MTKKKGIPLLAIAFSSYIFLGMPNGLLGVAWPSIRESFGLPLDALGTLLTTVTIGYMLSSFNSGRLIARLGAAILLMISSILMAVGVLGYMVSPNWWTMVASGFLVGLGNGTVDAGLNTYVAENYQARHMNWLHAFFGIGVTFGPMIMTAMLNAGLSWRWGYVVVLVLEAVLAVVYWFTRHRWTSNSSNAVEPDTGTIVVKARSLDSLRLAPVWLGIALFVMHPGIEFVAGQWSYTLFTEGRSVLPTVASLWLSIYWASLTVGRLILGSVADRIGVDNLLRWCMGGILVG